MQMVSDPEVVTHFKCQEENGGIAGHVVYTNNRLLQLLALACVTHQQAQGLMRQMYAHIINAMPKPI